LENIPITIGVGRKYQLISFREKIWKILKRWKGKTPKRRRKGTDKEQMVRKEVR
jgi:hypothetical protein